MWVKGDPLVDPRKKRNKSFADNYHSGDTGPLVDQRFERFRNGWVAPGI